MIAVNDLDNMADRFCWQCSYSMMIFMSKARRMHFTAFAAVPKKLHKQNQRFTPGRVSAKGDKPIKTWKIKNGKNKKS